VQLLICAKKRHVNRQLDMCMSAKFQLFMNANTDSTLWGKKNCTTFFFSNFAKMFYSEIIKFTHIYSNKFEQNDIKIVNLS